MSFSTKVYVVQQYDRDGRPGEVIGVKTAFGPAHTLAKAHAPAKVLYAMADKTDLPNIPEQYPNQRDCS